jgi:hypothetical protein
MGERMTVLKFCAILCMLLCFIVVANIAAKNLSYYFWYEDMVKATIRQEVKQEALKGPVALEELIEQEGK